jgi:hypothetical protein
MASTIEVEDIEEAFAAPPPTDNEERNGIESDFSQAYIVIANAVVAQLNEGRHRTIAVSRLESSYQSVLNGLAERYTGV